MASLGTAALHLGTSTLIMEAESLLGSPIVAIILHLGSHDFSSTVHIVSNYEDLRSFHLGILTTRKPPKGMSDFGLL